MDKDNSIKNDVQVFKNPASKYSGFCFEWLESLIQAIVFILILFTFFFRTMKVDGESMMNTLHDNDKIFVSKWKYKPTDGDVVTIVKGQNYDKPIVKRVIATEGQSLKIDFSDGSVYVDGKKLDEYYIKEKMWLQEDGEIPDVIPAGYSFVMGDNRNHSADSRSKAIGLIDNKDIIGKVKFIFYPLNRIGVVK